MLIKDKHLSDGLDFLGPRPELPRACSAPPLCGSQSMSLSPVLLLVKSSACERNHPGTLAVMRCLSRRQSHYCGLPKSYPQGYHSSQSGRSSQRRGPRRPPGPGPGRSPELSPSCARSQSALQKAASAPASATCLQAVVSSVPHGGPRSPWSGHFHPHFTHDKAEARRGQWPTGGRSVWWPVSPRAWLSPLSRPASTGRGRLEHSPPRSVGFGSAPREARSVACGVLPAHGGD